mmetsp:Transcript_35230/g.49313  ORF Transcript_35230/g.49313 Transcript_35230/m.49313 type:complete len:402 (-) Transcript_35230:110-1315(-)
MFRTRALMQLIPKGCGVLRAQRRLIHSHMEGMTKAAVNLGMKYARNGLLESDDYYTNGVPECQFKFDHEKYGSITKLFDSHRHVDPFVHVQNDLQGVTECIKDIVGSDHKVLNTVASYFIEAAGKRVRPAIVLLVAESLHGGELPSEEQGRIAQISEMIHTASLLHDDVIDKSDTRRGLKTINKMFGNKMAVLGGDFLLARASLTLARLKDPVVIELMSTIIEHLVKGELMQIHKAEPGNGISNYITKSYYKTASLMANSCKSAAILGGHEDRVQELAYEYGKNLGLAFQVVDDLLDFESTSDALGKPTLADINAGLATAPVLYAAQNFPEVQPLIDRKFSQVGDVQLALHYVEKSGALGETRTLATSFAESAVAAACEMPECTARSALIALVERVLLRNR